MGVPLLWDVLQLFESASALHYADVLTGFLAGTFYTIVCHSPVVPRLATADTASSC